MSTPPGWYPDPDPQGQGSPRWWDGNRWTPHVAEGQLPAAPGSSSRNWAVVAHLSPIGAMLVAMAFLGPLTVYLLKPDDPFVRDQAREALNFQLSALLYAVALVVGILFLVGLILLPFFAATWLVLIAVAASRASRGEAFRYPLTIRFVR